MDTPTLQPPKPLTNPIEELPLAERLKLADAFDHTKYFAPGVYVDTRDTVSSWCLAEIQKVSVNEVSISFDGWSAKYDENFRIKSSRLAPFRMYSRGYTGQIRIPLRRLEYSVEWLEAQTKTLNEVIESDFGSLKTAFEVTQYLRGRIFILVDFLMAYEYKNTDEDPKRVIEFLKLVLRLLVRWLELFPNYRTAFAEGEQYPKLYLVDRNVAFASCSYELLDMSKSLFCLCHRSLQFFCKHDMEIDPTLKACHKDIQVKFVEKRKCKAVEVLKEELEQGKEFVFGQFINFFNYFVSLKGLEAVYNIIGGKTGKTLPLYLIAMILEPFRNIRSFVKKEIAEKIVEEGKKAFFEKIQKIDNKELKDLNKDLIARALNLMKSFLEILMKEDEANKMVEAHEMQLSLRLIKCPFLEKRLKGISDIKSLIDRLELNGAGDYTGARYMNRETYRKPVWITAEYLAEWIQSNKLLSEILNQDAHSEIVKRSSGIMIFLARQNKLTTEDLELLWRCQVEKHEDIVLSVYETLKEILPYLTGPFMDYIFKKLKSFPLEQVSEKTIMFMSDFTIKAFKQKTIEKIKQDSEGKTNDILEQEPMDILTEKKEELTIVYDEVPGSTPDKPQRIVHKPTDPELFCVPILYEIIQDESNASAGLIDVAAKALQETLIDDQCTNHRSQYLYLALQQVKENKSVPQNLQLANFLLRGFRSMRSAAISTGHWQKAAKAGMEKLAKDGFPLGTMILQSLRVYEDAVEARLDKQKVFENIPEMALIGKMKHKSNIDERLTFLELVLQSGGKDSFGKDSITNLWNLFMKRKYSMLYESNAFINWISAEKENTLHNLPVVYFNPDGNTMLFVIICANAPELAQSQVINFFKCFSKQYKLINSENNSAEVIRGKIRVNSFKDLIGLEKFWEIVTSVNFVSEKMRAKFVEMLVNMYANFNESLSEKRYEIYSNFIERCFTIMKKAESTDNQDGLSKTISLLLLFLDTLYGKKYTPKEEEEEVKSYYSSKYPVSVLLKPDKKSAQFEIGTNAIVGEIKKRVADYFHVPFCMLQLSGLSKGEFLPEEYDEELRNIGWCNNFTACRFLPTAKKVPLEPKCLVSDNEEYMAYLFHLLSKSGTIYGDVLWNLLTSLPRNEKISKGVFELSVPEANPGEFWNNLFDASSTHKLLYSLQIVEEILSHRDAGAEKGSKEHQDVDLYIEKFTEKGGLNHIFQAFLNLPIDHVSQQLSRQCYSILMKLIYIIQQKCGTKIIKYIPNYRELRPKAIQKTLAVLNAFSVFSILPKAMLKTVRSPKKQDLSEYFTRGRGKKEVKKEVEDQEAESKSKLEKKKKEIEESEGFMKGWILIKGTEPGYDFMAEVLRYPELKSLLQRGLILSDNETMKQHFGQELIKIKQDYKEINDNHPYMTLFPILFGELLNLSLTKEKKTEGYFMCLQKLVQDYSPQQLLSFKFPFSDLISSLTEMITLYESKELLASDNDYTLAGIISLLAALLMKFPQYKLEVGQSKKLIFHLLHSCLYETPNISKIKSTNSFMPPKCKSHASRDAALNLICVLSRNIPENMNQIIGYLSEIHRNGAWRTEKDWEMSVRALDKSLTGYVGIKNLGCICYMISLFQQLYMIPTFRNDVLASAESTTANPTTPLAENPLFQAQCLFASLNESMKQCCNPKAFCLSFKDWDGKSLDTMEQMDVDEFFNLFMDRMENLLKGTPQAKTIKYHFGGLFANQFIGKDCPHRKSRQEPFLAINLQVKNKKSLQQCLNSYVEGELLQGSNAYHCEGCDKKVTTLNRSCIKKLPRHLIFVLKRFEFNYDLNQKVKVNDYCEFPYKLNMEPYTEEGLLKKDKEKEREKARKEGREYVEEPNNTGVTMKPKEYYEYQLHGVLIHLGQADYGHYYSLIMDREKTWLPEKDRWFEFNDANVDKYDPDEIKNDAFGGEETWGGFEGFQGKKWEKIRNAYLLVYDRITECDVPDEDEDDPAAAAAASKGPPAKVGIKGAPLIPDAIHKAVLSDNLKYLQSRYIFGSEYMEFIKKLIMGWDTRLNLGVAGITKDDNYALLGYSEEVRKAHSSQTTCEKVVSDITEDSYRVAKEEDIEKCQIQAGKFCILFFITTALRSNMRATYLPSYLDLSKAYINKYYEVASWILAHVANQKIFSEVIYDCTIREMKQFSIGIIYCAMLKVFSREKSLVAEGDARKSVLVNFINYVVTHACMMRKRKNEFVECYQLISRFVSLGPEARLYAHKKSLLKKLISCQALVLNSTFDDLSDFPYYECWALPKAEEGTEERMGAAAKKSEPPVCEFGKPAEVDKRFMLDAEEAVKDDKTSYQHYEKNTRLFLVEAICILIQGFCFPEGMAKQSKRLISLPRKIPTSFIESPFVLPDPIPISKVELEIFQSIESNILGFAAEASRNSISRNAVIKAFAHLSYLSQSFCDKYLSSLGSDIKKSEWKDVKAYGFALKEALRAVAQDDPQRCIPGILLLLKELKQSQEAYYATVAGTEVLLGIASAIPFVYDYLKKGPQNYSFLTKWLSENMSPPQSRSGNMRLTKPGTQSNYYMNMEYSQNEGPWKAQVKQLIEGFALLEKGLPLTLFSKVFSSYEVPANYYSKYMIGQIVETDDPRGFGTSRYEVKIVLDEMLHAVTSSKLYEGGGQWLLIINEVLKLPEEAPPKKGEKKVTDEIDGEEQDDAEKQKNVGGDPEAIDSDDGCLQP